MNINNINGTNAYSNIPASSPPVDNTQLQKQNLEASRSEVESQDRANQAFNVRITQEARQKLAAQNTENTQQTPIQEPDTANRETTKPAQDASQIVNIVA